jgi:type IV pilus assembly protein PilN
MRDFNFFSPYLESKKKFKNNYFFIIVLCSALGLYILGTTGWYVFNNIVLKRDIRSINAQLNDTKLIEQYKKAEADNTKYNLMNKYSDGAAELVKNFQKKDIVSTASINEILSCMPQDVFLASINMSEGSIQLQCTSKSIVTAAEFEHNLIKLDKFKEVSISAINGDAAKMNYGFSINCTLKGVDNNENKQK